MFFEKPALEQSWSISVVQELPEFLLVFSKTSFLVLKDQSEKLGLAVGKSVGKNIESKFSFAAGFSEPREFLANSLHKSATAPWTRS